MLRVLRFGYFTKLVDVGSSQIMSFKITSLQVKSIQNGSVLIVPQLSVIHIQRIARTDVGRNIRQHAYGI